MMLALALTTGLLAAPYVICDDASRIADAARWMAAFRETERLVFEPGSATALVQLGRDGTVTCTTQHPLPPLPSGQ